MRIKTKKDSVFEKMSINEDVLKISKMVVKKFFENPEQKIELNNIILSNNYKISSLTIEKYDEVESIFKKSLAFFDSYHSKKTDDGYILKIKVKDSLTEEEKNRMESILYHEIQHGIDFLIKKEKNSKENPKYNYKNLSWMFMGDGLKKEPMPKETRERFGHIQEILYAAYDSEIKSRLHEIYVNFKKYLSDNDIKHPSNGDVNNFIKIMIETKNKIWIYYEKLINYDIMKDVKNDMATAQTLLEFLTNSATDEEIKTVLKRPYKRDDSCQKPKRKTMSNHEIKAKLKEVEKYIKKQGMKYRNKAHKILFLVVNELNK
jgi:hypothetical protein